MSVQRTGEGQGKRIEMTMQNAKSCALQVSPSSRLLCQNSLKAISLKLCATGLQFTPVLFQDAVGISYTFPYPSLHLQPPEVLQQLLACLESTAVLIISFSLFLLSLNRPRCSLRIVGEHRWSLSVKSLQTQEKLVRECGMLPKNEQD